jgi:hypothetical protein
MADFTKPDELRQRFAELTEQRSQILALSTPKRAARDKVVADAALAAAPLDAEIKRIEAELFDLDQEAALIARALGGRTGS